MSLTPNKQGTSKQAAAIRRKIFIEAYITNGGNATAAAIEAGYSKKTARQQAARLLTDVDISRQIASRAEKIARKYELNTELVTKSIVQELTFDPVKLYDKDGQLKAISDLDEDTRMALASVEFEQHGSLDAPVFVRKIKWAARSQAREQAMKHLGMFERDNDQRKQNVTFVVPTVNKPKNAGRQTEKAK
jgi:phage terminase small subunit